MKRMIPSQATLAVCLALLISPCQAQDTDWTTVTPPSVGLDPAPLQQLTKHIRDNPDFNIHSVLIVKDGKLAFEEYFSGQDQDWGRDLGHVAFDRDTRHDLRSVTKSVTSALIGIAIAEGKLPSVDTTVPELFPQHSDHFAPDKKSLTLRHILSMTAGLDWFEPPDYTNPGNDEIRLTNSPDPVAFVLGRSFATPPGERFQYNGGLPTLLGYLLEQAYSERGERILEKKLLKPLGISGFDFRANRSGLLAYASGLRLRPRDIAKIGQLYLNEGEWNGKQVLPPEWVKHSLTSHTETDWTPGYGYQWWIMRFESPERSMWVPAAVGNGGQRIFVIRPLEMVVVVTAGNYNQADVPLSGRRMLTDFIFPAAGMPNMVGKQ